jgi:hypothetical protein
MLNEGGLFLVRGYYICPDEEVKENRTPHKTQKQEGG